MSNKILSYPAAVTWRLMGKIDKSGKRKEGFIKIRKGYAMMLMPKDCFFCSYSC